MFGHHGQATDDVRQSLMDSAEYDICLKYNPYSEFPCHV